MPTAAITLASIRLEIKSASVPTPAAVAITKGLTTISTNTNKVVANDDTVFLVRDTVNGNYVNTYTNMLVRTMFPA